MKTMLIVFGFLFMSFNSIAEEGGAPGTICLMDSGAVVTTHLQTCPKNMTKL
ncbi:hypothetical protein BCU66_011140 [Vibrio sp. 10N.286.49.B1]|uniref:hypothetical protein n=1 Tax=unclassified Vibrio TaxID=2614977 RepID=UPI0018E433E0|nr:MULTISPECIES: hypothetical protein [unclassified Vibrio]